MRQLMFSFEGDTPPAPILDGVRDGKISSFCLFSGQNGTTPAQIRALTDALHTAAAEGGHPPPLIGIDQEGGQLMAIAEGVTELPGNMALGAAGSTELAYAAGGVLARELLAMGVNLNFAPALDVNINPANPVIGTRAFGDTPEAVARLGVALLRGLQDNGVMATAKHFPGHGDTAQDTHHSSAVIPHPLERLQTVELPPFEAAIAAEVGAVMTAHIRVTALDADNPATLSPAVISDLLRGQFSYTGLVITDAMDMHAVARFGAQASTQAALDAGVDLVLLGHLPGQFALMKHFAAQERPGAVARIQRARARLPRTLPALETLQSAENQAIARQIAEQSITVVQGSHALPIPADAAPLVLMPVPENLTPADTSAGVTIDLAGALRPFIPGVRGACFPMRPTPNDIAGLLALAEGAEVVIVGTLDAAQHPAQAELVKALHAAHPNLIAVALRTPYDLMAYPQVANYLCTYGIRQPSIDALACVLAGSLKPTGQLPCKIPGHAAQPT